MKLHTSCWLKELALQDGDPRPWNWQPPFIQWTSFQKIHSNVWTKLFLCSVFMKKWLIQESTSSFLLVFLYLQNGLSWNYPISMALPLNSNVEGNSVIWFNFARLISAMIREAVQAKELKMFPTGISASWNMKFSILILSREQVNKISALILIGDNLVLFLSTSEANYATSK